MHTKQRLQIKIEWTEKHKWKNKGEKNGSKHLFYSSPKQNTLFMYPQMYEWRVSRIKLQCFTNIDSDDDNNNTTTTTIVQRGKKDIDFPNE